MTRKNIGRRGGFLVAAASVAVLLLAACGSDGDDAGQVRADGSSTVGPLTSVAAELFAEDGNKAKVSVATHGTGGGFEKFCAGEVDIANASRAIKDTEIQACETEGVKYQELLVANDALTVAVSKDNSFVQCLTTDQLRRLWDSESPATNWSQVDSSFPDAPITLYGPGTDSGTFDFFTKEINGEEGRSRTDYTPSEDDNLLVRGVADNENALGYFGYTYFEENTDKLRAVKVDSGAGCVAPSVETAQDNSYAPLSRPLYIYVSDKALGRDEVVDFVEYYIDNIDDIVKEAKFIPLTKTQSDQLADEFAAFRDKVEAA